MAGPPKLSPPLPGAHCNLHLQVELSLFQKSSTRTAHKLEGEDGAVGQYCETSSWEVEVKVEVEVEVEVHQNHQHRRRRVMAVHKKCNGRQK